MGKTRDAEVVSTRSGQQLIRPFISFLSQQFNDLLKFFSFSCGFQADARLVERVQGLCRLAHGLIEIAELTESIGVTWVRRQKHHIRLFGGLEIAVPEGTSRLLHEFVARRFGRLRGNAVGGWSECPITTRRVRLSARGGSTRYLVNRQASPINFGVLRPIGSSRPLCPVAVGVCSPATTPPRRSASTGTDGRDAGESRCGADTAGVAGSVVT